MPKRKRDLCELRRLDPDEVSPSSLEVSLSCEEHGSVKRVKQAHEGSAGVSSIPYLDLLPLIPGTSSIPYLDPLPLIPGTSFPRTRASLSYPGLLPLLAGTASSRPAPKASLANTTTTSYSSAARSARAKARAKARAAAFTAPAGVKKSGSGKKKSNKKKVVRAEPSQLLIVPAGCNRSARGQEIRLRQKEIKPKEGTC
jgi:hypothetical protein